MTSQMVVALVALGAASGFAVEVCAQAGTPPTPALAANITYKADVIDIDAGRGRRAFAYLDDAELTLSVNFDQAVGWRGGSAFADVLNNFGDRPNKTAGTLQGVDNIEVAAPALRLYQAWVQQTFAGDRVSLLAGLYDINSEFYHNDAAGQLINPVFGIGSELSSTGPNGPSTFPYTETAVRIRYAWKRDYVQIAMVRAPRGTVDPVGKRTLLLIAEAGRQGSTALSVGAWTYLSPQPEIVPPGLLVDGRQAASRGAYILAEQDVAGGPNGPGYWRAFLRAGVADGNTTPFSGGMQVGLSGRHVLTSRPDSNVSIGYGSACLSDRYRRTNPADAPPLTASETVLELTYSDRLLPFLTLQPDLQYVFRPSGLRNADDVIVLGLRAIINWNMP
jgi:porin